MCRRATELSQIQDAFNPNPLTSRAELDQFYQQTFVARTGDDYFDFVRSFSVELDNCKEVVLHKLFIGHPGCGKTTELYKLQQKTQEMGFITCLGRCDLELDSADIEYTDVLFYILDLLVNAAESNGIRLDAELVRSIIDYWEQDIEVTKEVAKQEEAAIEHGAEISVGIPNLLNVFARVKGVIKNSSDSRKKIRQNIEPKSSELIRRIQDVIDIFSKKAENVGKKKIPLIILDGLDKIPLEQARKIFRENGSRFNALNVHLLVTFPIALTYAPEYSDIQSWFPSSEKLPMIKLKKWDGRQYIDGYKEGMNTMRQIVEKRAEFNLFEENVLDEFIRKTGGYIRDLFRCIAKAALRAQIRGASAIDMSDAEYALNVLESDINGRYKGKYIQNMRKIYEGEKYLTSSDDITELLQVGAVLEYNGQRWCDLHPLVEKWLKEHDKLDNVMN